MYSRSSTSIPSTVFQMKNSSNWQNCTAAIFHLSDQVLFKSYRSKPPERNESKIVQLQCSTYQTKFFAFVLAHNLIATKPSEAKRKQNYSCNVPLIRPSSFHSCKSNRDTKITHNTVTTNSNFKISNSIQQHK
jgi:hypothetical protein